MRVFSAIKEMFPKITSQFLQLLNPCFFAHFPGTAFQKTLKVSKIISFVFYCRKKDFWGENFGVNRKSWGEMK
jgi:hypothetical protein